MDGFLATLPTWLTDAESVATAYTVLQWVIRIASLVIVPFRRSPSAAKAWLLLIFFQPVIGLVLYLVFGRAIQPRWLQRRRRAWSRMFTTILKNIQAITTKRGLNLKHDLPLQATYLQKHFPLPPSGGNKVELIADYDTFNDQLVADIASARHHVHLLFYIFKNDAVGNRIVAALAEAAGRGVTCRVLLDAIGSWPRARIRHRLKKAGVHVHSALPLSRKGWHTRADLRNHRKIAVIDGTVAYTGSQNLVKPARNGTRQQQELMVRLHGPSVLGMQAIFAADWFLESEEVLDAPAYYPLLPPKPYGDVITQVLPSGPDYPGASVDDLLVTLIHNARSKVVITTPYFIPSDPLLHALKSAVKRGVDVHLITSRKTDSALVLLAQRSYYSELLKANIHIHLYKSSFLHSKHLSIDGIACLIGSSNIDLRSFELNGEINLMVYSDKTTAELTRIETSLIGRSQTLHLKKWHKRSYILKLLENFARLLSPLL